MLIQYLINVKPLCVAYSPRPDEVMIMRYVQPLSDEQRALLEKTMKEDTAFRARSRAHSLLLSAAGTPIQTIANAYHVHRVTVSAWIKKWEHHGVQSLHDQPRSGRPTKLTPDEQELAQQYIKEEPRSLKGVVERLAHKTEKRLSISTLKRLAKKARLRWKRVRKSLTRIIHQPKKSTRENPFGGQMILTTLISQDHHAPKARSSDGLDSVQSGLSVVSRRTSSWQPPRADHHRFVRDPPEVSMALTGPATSDAPTLTTLHSALRLARLGTTRATKSGSVLEPLARGHPVSVSAIGSWPS